MFSTLFQTLKEKIALSEEAHAKLPQFFEHKTLAKKEFLLQEGAYCKQLAFVSKGLLKSYTIDEKGQEHISLLAWEGWWVSDFKSFICDEKAILFIDAVEASEVLLITHENYELMLKEIPEMERYFRILYQNSLVTKDRRLISSNSYTAEEKYKHLLELYPFIGKQVPQNLIASFLGITPETLSRIKKTML
ncbi:Crp/Fnr family transcriptional regulator [Leeuwenhoekiella marinoflava]|uniref:CRP-like cAMP-binding protein n=2 Tax=Leeuwenhoekiella marinoflava TaxID=988 RepID=A0A4Q0PJ26_9FLAO|nr:Crp/Fnr family transcriptional regulator [Leeuwenhoekiella marinoflava]RXG26835.1 CRP-like cAMP-binding protein [Leeuwenhoekiella marinoflava]SHF38980.1 cAMP-binding domain of CRP or a regulatory subunit of cAMP-dependent protein kinases [Leeuwenhoekiella marinoflava DSM 3653]